MKSFSYFHLMRQPRHKKVDQLAQIRTAEQDTEFVYLSDSTTVSHFFLIFLFEFYFFSIKRYNV